MTNFEKSSEFNTLFGNERGDPSNVDWDAARAQFALILEEFTELSLAIGEHNIKEVRDGAADLLETTYGLLHRLGFDANKDYDAVYRSNMSKFCEYRSTAEATRNRYLMMGVSCYIKQIDKYYAVISKYDQKDDKGKTYAAGKLLKSIEYKEPVFE